MYLEVGAMKQRPLVIKILACLYFLSPLFIIFEFMSLYGIGLNRLFLLQYAFTWYTVAIMVVTPIVGYGIWTVRKWGYYLLLAHSVFLIISNTVLYSSGLTTSPLWFIIVANVLIVGTIIMFVRKEVYAPYFNPQIRWWEQAKRYYYDGMKIIVKKIASDDILFEANSFDLSETGIFVASNKKVCAGDKFSFELVLKNDTLLYTDGQVMWVNTRKGKDVPAGFGCKFLNINNLFKKRIKYHLNDVKAKIRER